MATPTFKKGDRVRLKAWVTKPKLAGADNLLPHGRVGICDEDSTALIVNAFPYVCVKTPKLPKARRAIVAVEDLELMPERQVHVIKDGKVYELRNNEPALHGTNLCRPCALFRYNCKEAQNGKHPCFKPGTNYQEVASGKLVS